MTRWTSCLRRAASLLLGIHFLQVGVLAANPACEPVAAAVALESETASVTPAHHHHGGGHAPDAMTTSVHAGDASDTTTPRTPASHRVDCAMAMVCAVAAVRSEPLSVTTSIVTVSTLRTSAPWSVPQSRRAAPEPPPPRA